MRIKIISDLHFGVKGTISNDFMINEELFTRYIESTLAEYDQLILAGDVFELWEEFFNLAKNPPSSSKDIEMTPTSTRTDGEKESKPGVFTMDMFKDTSVSPFLKEKITERYHNIIKSWSFMPTLLNHEKVVIINGNHDAMIRTIPLITNKNISQSYSIDMIGYRIYIAHGHQGDFFNQDNSICKWFSCCCKETMDVIDVLIDPRLDDDISRLAQLTLSNIDAVTDYAFTLTEKLPCDVVVFGHTHERGMWKRDGKIYLNSGCFVDKMEIIDEIVIISDDVKRTLHLEVHQYDLKDGTVSNAQMTNLSGKQ